MSNARYLDPTGQPTYGIGICGRCSRKLFLSELAPDPNYPGLMVCDPDRVRPVPPCAPCA